MHDTLWIVGPDNEKFVAPSNLSSLETENSLVAALPEWTESDSVQQTEEAPLHQ